jgi:serine/threonine-protein kinase RsbW
MEPSDAASDRAAVELRLNHDGGAPMLARAAVRELLADQLTTEELRHDAALVVFELMSNAVDHGLPESDGRVSLTCEIVEGQLVVVVTDGGHNGVVAISELDRAAARGRGLAIVDALTLTWTVDRSDGTVIRAVLPLRWPGGVDL